MYRNSQRGASLSLAQPAQHGLTRFSAARRSVVFFCAAVLSACGGGNSGLSSSTPPVIAPPATAAFLGTTPLAAGRAHVLAVDNNGNVRSWGANYDGQLGLGDQVAHPLPALVQGLPRISSVAAGLQHSLALGADGSVWAWGDNSGGQVGAGVPQARCSPFAPETFTCALRPAAVPGIGDAVAISAGSFFSAALKRDGTVWVWGQNDNGILGNPQMQGGNGLVPVQVPALLGVVSISAGASHLLALRADGTVWAWGGNYVGQVGVGNTDTVARPTLVAGLGTVVAIRAGSIHSLALRTDGTVLAWGDNSKGSLGNAGAREACSAFSFNVVCSKVPVPSVGVVQGVFLVGGNGFSMVYRQDRSAWVFGINSPPLVASALATDTCHLDRSVNVACLLTPLLAVNPWPGSPVSVVGGDAAVFARMADGSVFSMGFNTDGQLGDGSLASSNAPVRAAFVP